MYLVSLRFFVESVILTSKDQKLKDTISQLNLFKLLELETVHTPGSELASAIKVVNKVKLVFSLRLRM